MSDCEADVSQPTSTFDWTAQVAVSTTVTVCSVLLTFSLFSVVYADWMTTKVPVLYNCRSSPLICMLRWGSSQTNLVLSSMIGMHRLRLKACCSLSWSTRSRSTTKVLLEGSVTPLSSTTVILEASRKKKYQG